MKFRPRPAQQEIIKYTGGYMGVSAVPGSGKTYTLSYLASKLIAEGNINDDQEILIVTLVNSAVRNFSNRIEGFIRDFGLLPGLGYRVRTLHGLAHDIVKEKPGVVGLSENFQILDERERNQIISDIVRNWTTNNPDFFNVYKSQNCDLDNYKAQKDWADLLTNVVSNFISQAKDYRINSGSLSSINKSNKIDDPLLDLGLSTYSEYQRLLNYRNALDFDDLIIYALNALEIDNEYLERLSYRWPFILEDEAQDSSRLQELILRYLSNKNGNWVRVGDPNQAIFETFTTANPKYLLDFLNETNTVSKDLPNSGRSTLSIIKLANHLISWSKDKHPNLLLRDTLTPPYILPAPVNDPQPNPPDTPQGVFIYGKELTPDEEIDLIISSINRWLPEHPDQTLAVLVPRNDRGAKVVEKLNAHNIDYVELLKSSLSTRETARVLSDILKYLNEPASKAKLINLVKYFNDDNKNDPTRAEVTLQEVTNYLKKTNQIEEIFWPLESLDGYDTTSTSLSGNTLIFFTHLKSLIKKWQCASMLPIDQLIIIISQDIFTKPVDLALAHKLALTLEIYKNAHPEYGFIQFVEELDMIANNRHRYLGFSNEDISFDPDLYPGKVTVSTIHKAKGLEWDRVYLMSVNNYNFPSADNYDQFIGEKWFVKGEINLQAEVLSKLDGFVSSDPVRLYYEYGSATQDARVDYARERLRLLFVGITRARKELMITWNTGKNASKKPSLPAVALTALKTFYEDEIYAINE